eukprot:1146729-Pelagomonas_calceolata.AAC.4
MVPLAEGRQLVLSVRDNQSNGLDGLTCVQRAQSVVSISVQGQPGWPCLRVKGTERCFNSIIGAAWMGQLGWSCLCAKGTKRCFNFIIRATWVALPVCKGHKAPSSSSVKAAAWMALPAKGSCLHAKDTKRCSKFVGRQPGWSCLQKGHACRKANGLDGLACIRLLPACKRQGALFQFHPRGKLGSLTCVQRTHSGVPIS